MNQTERHEGPSATLLVDTQYQPPAGFGGVNTPTYRASTVTFASVAAMRARDWRREDGYTYGLHGTPTTFTLAHRIGEIEGARYCTLAPSGLAAITLINFALLRSADHVLLPDNVYAPGRELVNRLHEAYGVEVSYYDPLAGQDLEHLVRANTRLIWIEAPGSITMEVPDIAAIVAVARKHQIVTAIDNTWSGGLYLRPFAHGVDLCMHALTKYPSGGSDVLMGSVTTNDVALHEQIKLAHMRLGMGVSGDDASLMLRSLPTLAMRLDHHAKAGAELATWLEARAEVALVLHPALPECPGHANWKRDFTGGGGLFSIVLREDIAQDKVDAMVDALRIFRIGFSWGGSHSLAVPYLMSGARTAKPWPHRGSLVRFYVGLEDISELKADLEQAFSRLA
jgi:cysteine-S-conjugate beta-lyase